MASRKTANVTPSRATIEIAHKPIAALIPNARNARTHADAQVVEIAGSIRRFGFVNPVLIDEQGGVIAGHGRILAAKMLGLATAPTIMVSGLSETERKVLALADNRIALNSGWDVDLLRSEIEALQDGGENVLALGFTGDEISALFDEGQAVSVKEVDTSPVADRFWISIRGPLGDQADALSRLEQAMSGLTNVEVELGTTAID